jgi:hypothetical protein
MLAWPAHVAGARGRRTWPAPTPATRAWRRGHATRTRSTTNTRQLEELVTRALPHCGPAQSGCIADIALCRGDVAAELLGLIERKRVSVLVTGWHGRFATGRARVLKRLIGAITAPVLLVKSPLRMPFRLKVGEGMER